MSETDIEEMRQTIREFEMPNATNHAPVEKGDDWFPSDVLLAAHEAVKSGDVVGQIDNRLPEAYVRSLLLRAHNGVRHADVYAPIEDTDYGTVTVETSLGDGVAAVDVDYAYDDDEVVTVTARQA